MTNDEKRSEAQRIVRELNALIGELVIDGTRVAVDVDCDTVIVGERPVEKPHVELSFKEPDFSVRERTLVMSRSEFMVFIKNETPPHTHPISGEPINRIFDTVYFDGERVTVITKPVGLLHQFLQPYEVGK